jgi:glycosyltransferase involved in cell wall biosynthesis
VLLAISVAKPDPRTRAEIAEGVQPRRDFDELRRALGPSAEVLFLDQLDSGSAVSGLLTRALGQRVGRRVAMALAIFRRRSDYDVIFTDTDAVGLPLALMLRLRRPGRAGVRHVTLTHNLSSMRNPFASWCKRMLFRLGAASRIDTMIVHSSAQRFLAQTEFGVAPDHVVLLPYQVDTAFWQPLAAPTSEADRPRPLILVPGHECRDYPTLLAAVDGLDVDVRISTRAVTAEQEAMTRRPDWPPNLSFRAYDYPSLRRLYADASFVIVPLIPVDFQAGITVVLEAMAMGKAVVVSGIRGQTDVVRAPSNGRGPVERGSGPGLIELSDVADSLGQLPTGIYVTPGDPADLRRAIEHLLSEPELADELGRNGRAIAEALFSIESFAERFATAIAGDRDALQTLSRLHTDSARLRAGESAPVSSQAHR